ncbi:MAG: hypothetical protein RL238_898 [Actinomycetota bacterium]
MSARRPLLGPLGRRLAAAFVVVAVAAIAVFAVLTMVAARSEVSGLTDSARSDDLNATAVAAGQAYRDAGGWDRADLSGTAAVAARGQATLTVTDADGQLVAAPTDTLASMMMQMHGMAMVDMPRGDPVSQPVMVDDAVVGAVTLRFPTETMGAARHVRDALARNALLGLALGALVALVVAVYVSARVTRPVTALTAAAADLAAGRRDSRVEEVGPGELRRLAETFNSMADSIDREDQLRRNLVADVAHELRTPLAILQGSTEALLDGVDQPTAENLTSLHDEVTRLRRIVGDLETLASAEAAGLQLRTGDVDVAEVAAAAVDLLRPLADDREVRLVVAGEGSPTVGDVDRLQQVAVNLLTNGIKFSPRGGTVTVTTSTHDGGVRLEVCDEGPGVPETEQERVFERFWRGTNGASAGGSGIGLAVVRELVHAHRGTVTVTNREQGGACFVVELPGRR